MKKLIVIAGLFLVCGLVAHESSGTVPLGAGHGRTGWEVPLEPGLGVRICEGSRHSQFNIRGDRPGAEVLTLVATVREGTVVDLSGYDDLCTSASMESVRLLGPIEVSETIEFLLSLVDSNSRIADEAVGFLAVIGAPSIPGHLKRIATTHRDEEVRADAVFMATLRLDSDALPFLEGVMRNDASREVRERAVFSISQLESPESREVLERIARTDRDVEVRANAVFWLTETSGADALRVLRALTDDPEEDVVEAAIFGISRIDEEDAAHVLVELAKNHRNSEVREKAIFWLAERASEHLEAAIDEILVGDESEDVLEAAVFAVSRMPARESIPILERLATTHRNPDVREQAIFWLGQKDDPRAVAALESIILN